MQSENNSLSKQERKKIFLYTSAQATLPVSCHTHNNEEKFCSSAADAPQHYDV